MKMWSLNVMILLLFCYACLSTGDGKVFFVSKNFFNILHWDPVKPDFPGQTVLYSVSYLKHGGEQFKVKQCQNITALTCNLTLETQSLHDTQYVACVIVGNVSRGHTNRFKPLADTTLGPPILSESAAESRLSVNVTLPLGPNGESIADIIARSNKVSSRTVFVYTLNVTHPEWAAQIIENHVGQFVIDLKKPAKYCGEVVYKPSVEWGRKESERASFCVSPPDNPSVHWILVAAAALAALLTVAVVLVCAYVRGGKPKNLPGILAVSSAARKVQQYPDRNLIISEIAIRAQNEETSQAKVRERAVVPVNGSEGYSPQGVPCHLWPDSTGSSVGSGASGAMPDPEDTSGQSSDNYGGVAVQVPDEEDEDSLQGEGEDGEPAHPLLSPGGPNWDNGGTKPVLIPCGGPSLSGFDFGRRDSMGPLVLHTSRGVDGKLTLPSFTSSFQSGGDVESSPVGPERKPLLQDIIIESQRGPSLASLDTSEWSDSGCDDSASHTPTTAYCNSNYIASQPVSSYLQQGTLPGDASDEQGYKPNWMPAIPHESETSCDTRRTDCPWAWTGVDMEEEGEEDEGTESHRQIVLGNWTLQIQE